MILGEVPKLSSYYSILMYSTNEEACFLPSCDLRYGLGPSIGAPTAVSGPWVGKAVHRPGF